MRARQDIDAVDLEQAEPVMGAPKLRGADIWTLALAECAAKSLRRERNAPRLLERESEGHRARTVKSLTTQKPLQRETSAAALTISRPLP